MKISRKSNSMLFIGLAAFTVVWLMVFVVIGRLGDEMGETAETFGSLDGRFVSSVQYEYGGKRYAFRENDISCMLVIGSDKTETAGSGFRSGGQADFLLLLVTDNKNDTVTPIQIDRDTMTSVKMFGTFGGFSGYRNTHICLSHCFGRDSAENCENTVWAVSNLLCGLPIDSYVAVDMGSIAKLNDLVGGVTVSIEDDMVNIDPSFRKGAVVKLLGSRAEEYVRARMSVSDGTNASRMRRQRGYLTAFQNVLSEKMNSDRDFAGTIFDAMGDELVTNLSRGALINQSYRMVKYASRDTVVFNGRYSIGSDGFYEFEPDTDELCRTVLTMCFEEI